MAQLDNVKEVVDILFGDRSRSNQEIKEDLKEVVRYCEEAIDSLKYDDLDVNE